MAKFDIDAGEMKKATGEAALKHVAEHVAEDDMTIATIRDIPKSWGKLIKKETGNTFASYARMAIRQQMQRDGIID